MRVARVIGEVLAESGVAHFFGLIGSGNFDVANALVGSGATFVSARHETGAVTMADAYARVSGRLGVCTVHQGPGLTNAITGLTEAAKSRTPLLLLAAETSAAAIHSNFRIDQWNLVASLGAIAERINGPATAAADALRAIHRAQVERRPVVLMMPLDVQAADTSPPADLRLMPMPPPSRPSAEAVSGIADRIRAARRPLILAGRGAVISYAREPLERLGDLTGALFVTSAAAYGLFAGNPWSLGMAGHFTSPVSLELISESDLVLAFGASLNMWTTRRGHLISPGAVVVQVDDDAKALASQHRVDLAVVGDVGETARALLQEVEKRDGGWRTAEVEERIRNGTWHHETYEDVGDGHYVDPRTVSIAVDEMVPSDRAVALDSGHFMVYPAKYLRVSGSDAFILTQGFQSIGLGLASAIGAAVARPDRITVAALGDGGTLMSLPEFETAARLRLPILILVYNDSAYSAEVHHFGPMGKPVDLVRFSETDFAAIGRAVGLQGITVRHKADIAPLREWVAQQPGSGLVLDAKIPPGLADPWLEEAMRGH